MPRRLNYETRIRCHTCHNYTQSIEPVIIKKEFVSRFHFKAVCVICNKFKTKYLNQEKVKVLPNEIKDSIDGSTFTNTIERNGILISIIPLISTIVIGISTLPSQGTIVSGVLPNKQTNEQIVAQVIELKDKYISNTDNGIIIDSKLADLVISLVPIVIKIIPSAVNTIKNLINDETINTLEKVLSDSDLSVKKTISDRALSV